MNSTHVEFLRYDFGIFHYNEECEVVYGKIKEKIELDLEILRSKAESKSNRGLSRRTNNSSRNKPFDINAISGIGRYGPFWKYVGKEPVFSFVEIIEEGLEFKKIALRQSSADGKESLAILGKAMEKLELYSSNGIITHNFDLSYYRDLSVTWFDIDFSQNIEKIVIYFKHNILDPLSLPVLMVTSKQIQVEKTEEQKKLDSIVPEIKHKFSLGDNLINIKFEPIYNHVPLKVIVELYDEDKFLMGTYAPEKGMNFLTINNLAYGKYYYIIRQFDLKDNEVQKTDFVEWSLVKPFYGKPLI